MIVDGRAVVIGALAAFGLLEFIVIAFLLAIALPRCRPSRYCNVCGSTLVDEAHCPRCDRRGP